MKILRGVFAYWLPVLALMGAIYLFSSDSNPYRIFPNAHPTPTVQATACAACRPAKAGPTRPPAPTSTPAPGQAATPSPSAPPAARKNAVPTTPLRPEYEALGRAAHVFEFALLGLLMARALAYSAGEGNQRSAATWIAALAFILALGFGLTDELHQAGVPGRTFQIVDLTLDALGAALGALVFWIIVDRRERRSVSGQ